MDNIIEATITALYNSLNPTDQAFILNMLVQASEGNVLGIWYVDEEMHIRHNKDGQA